MCQKQSSTKKQLHLLGALFFACPCTHCCSANIQCFKVPRGKVHLVHLAGSLLPLPTTGLVFVLQHFGISTFTEIIFEMLSSACCHLHVKNLSPSCYPLSTRITGQAYHRDRNTAYTTMHECPLLVLSGLQHPYRLSASFTSSILLTEGGIQT